jgi:hypothetical protein
MRKIGFIAFVLMLFTGLASAQIPTTGNVYFGYSYYNADLSSLGGRSSFNGWTLSGEGKVLPFIGIVADIGQTYGSEHVPLLCRGPACPSVSISAHELNLLFGPRASVSVGKIRPFAEVLLGVGHIGNDSGGASDTSFATAIGGGSDYKIIRPPA